MPIQQVEVRARLLDIFPAETLQVFPQVTEKMTKADAIAAVVGGASLPALRGFVQANFGRLHQHVYIFEKQGGNPAPDVPFGVAPFGTETRGQESHYFFLLPLTYGLILEGPAGIVRADLPFAWPVKIVVAPDHVRAHFAIMAKSPQAHVGAAQTVIRSTPSPTEKDLLADFPTSLGFPGCGPLDLNKGIKALWANDEIDAPVFQYKRSKSTAREVMDEGFLVKRDDPNRYAELVADPLYQTTYKFMGATPCIEYFLANPTNGTVDFRKFSDTEGCVDDVLGKILGAN